MLDAFSGDAKILLGADLAKLRRSPLAAHVWEQFGDHPRVQQLIEGLCGKANQLDYVLVAIKGFDGHEGEMWFRGVRRDTKFDCAKAKEHAASRQSKITRHGDYELTESARNVTEGIWADPETFFAIFQPSGAKPLGEAHVRDVVEHGGGVSGNRDIATLFEHVDFDSALWLVMDASLLQKAGEGVAGVTVALEADTDLRAQIFIQFRDEDRASNLQGHYRLLMDKFVKGHLIDSGEAKASGTGFAASVSLSRAQFDWWVDWLGAWSKDHNAKPPAPPVPSSG